MKYVKIEGTKKLTKFIKPMLATLSKSGPFDDVNWIYEIKWDGYRAIAEISLGEVKLYSRNGNTFDKAYPIVTNALKKIKANVILDGEIVVFDEDGKPNFQKLQNYKDNKHLPIQFFAFDCLSDNGKDMTSLPLVERKARLKKILLKPGVVMYCDHVVDNGKAFFKEVQKMNLEGIIAKKADSKYYENTRTANWLKIKNINTSETIVVGFTAPAGSRQYFGSLLLGAYKDGKLVSIGNVGTGFTDSQLKEIHTKLVKEIRKTCPLDQKINEKNVTWINPVYVCDVKFTELTEEGSLRHPVFQGLRMDTNPEDARMEQ